MAWVSVPSCPIAEVLNKCVAWATRSVPWGNNTSAFLLLTLGNRY